MAGGHSNPNGSEGRKWSSPGPNCEISQNASLPPCCKVSAHQIQRSELELRLFLTSFPEQDPSRALLPCYPSSLHFCSSLTYIPFDLYDVSYGHALWMRTLEGAGFCDPPKTVP